jgi:tellurite resistance protein TerC
MIAGASWTWWIGFHVVAIVLLAADWLLTGRVRARGHAQAAAWLGTAALTLGAVAFAIWIAYAQGHQAALEFAAGYTIEISLSIDNLFVFLILFEGFHVSERGQHQALLWGLGGAVILRGLFIAAGVTLLDHFHWVTWIFGLFLLYAAWRLLKGGSAKEAIPGWVRRMHPARGALLPVIVAVEFTDLVFATDSIPAVLAVSHNPFVVYTSNIAAILGLRSLYFALAGLLESFRYLHYGLGALLGFVAMKMLIADWIEIPIVLSLVVIGAILGVCALASALAARQENRA